jgi:prepilin-type N-terminal cleavage/methylation domain-containing protein
MTTASTRQAADGGFTIIETLVAMSLFAIGILALTQVQFAAARNTTTSKLTSTASFLASDRLEAVIYGPSFASMTHANYPDEAYGAVNSSDPRYKVFKRTVAVQDSLNSFGTLCLKTVTVKVCWKALNGERNVELRSRVARF